MDIPRHGTGKTDETGGSSDSFAIDVPVELSSGTPAVVRREYRGGVPFSAEIKGIGDRASILAQQRASGLPPYITDEVPVDPDTQTDRRPEQFGLPTDYEKSLEEVAEKGATALLALMDNYGGFRAQLNDLMSSGNSLEEVLRLTSILDTLQKQWLETAHQSVDSQGRDALQRLFEELSSAISKQLQANARKGSEYLATEYNETMDIINGTDEEESDEDLKEWATNHLEWLKGQSAFDSAKPVSFATQYNGAEVHADGHNDNTLLQEAMESAATIGEEDQIFDQNVYDALNGLLPNKLYFSVGPNGRAVFWIGNTKAVEL
ncbi:hypothetical protein FWG95_02835 [Candidatus Saccharibacteria bacterium]|nr:hypothetical protein [Candidatus Saccharibacteria bacterium]